MEYKEEDDEEDDDDGSQLSEGEEGKGDVPWLVKSKRPTGVLLYIEKIHAILAVWNQSTQKFV